MTPVALEHSGVSRTPAGRRPAETWRDQIEIASADSFPASDPPSWTPVTRTGCPQPSASAPAERPAEPSED